MTNIPTTDAPAPLPKSPKGGDSLELWIGYYDAIKELSTDQLTYLWEEETQDEYIHALGSVPPVVMGGTAFMVGEAMCQHPEGTIYEAHIQVMQRFFHRPALLKKFNPSNFRQQVLRQFDNP